MNEATAYEVWERYESAQKVRYCHGESTVV